MKLLTSSTQLSTEFRRLIKKYNEFYWATAWAGASSDLFKELLLKRDRIKKIVVGIHFYQTHPNFIEEFLNDNRVRFIQQPAGTFHPKLYIFYNNPKNWEIIVGSANFTNEAFLRNTEANILLSDTDDGSEDILNNAFELIDNQYEVAKVFKRKDLDMYLVTWKIQRQKLKSLSGTYGSKEKTSKPIHQIKVLNRGWDMFMDEIKKEPDNGLNNRLLVISIAQMLFAQKPHFHELSEDERKFIAGIPNRLDVKGSEYWPYFGSMKGAGIFKNRIKENDITISKALDQIPLVGIITKSHYNSFLQYFTKVFSGNYLATATRLLSMKRPDTFICFDSKNKSALCKDFGIVQSNMDYERYWDEIIERIYDSEWWLNPQPKNQKEAKVRDARVAFLDSLYYED